MKVERWEEENDEEWAVRLADEIVLANNMEASKYFIERDSYTDDGVIINYIGEDGWTWKEHPEGPFMAKQIIEWKNKAEKFDRLFPSLKHLVEHADKIVDVIEGVQSSTPKVNEK